MPLRKSAATAQTRNEGAGMHKQLSRKLVQRTKEIAHEPQASRLITEQLKLRLSPLARRLCWAIVLFFHVFNLVYCVILAYVYLYMMKPQVAYYAHLLNMMAPGKYFVIIAFYAMIAMLNMQSTLSMLVYTIWYRRLAFGSMKSRWRSAQVADTSTALEQPSYSNMRLVIRMIRNVWLTISVRGPWFEYAMMAREIVEIVSQLYQAYYSSLFVSQVWLNLLFAGLICFNCFAGTIVHIIQRHKPGHRRLNSIALDLVLDFIWGSAIPLIIVIQYIIYFVRNSYVFSPEFFYADTIYTNAILEFTQFFITSWTDAVTTMLPYANMFTGLGNMKVLLLAEIEKEKHQAPSIVSFRAESRATSIRHSKNDSRHSSPNKTIIKVSRRKPKHGEMHSIHFIIVVTGVFVCITSLAASGIFQSNQCDANCKLQMHPWFTTSCACSVYNLNCHQQGFEGTGRQIGDVLESLDARVLNYLIISHCPALTIPSAIRRFPKLMGLQIYNATFVDWPQESSLTTKHLPRLSYLYIVRSTFPAGVIPPGLLLDKSENLVDIEFVACNIADVPDDLDTRWPTVMIMFFEHCALQSVPRAITAMHTVVDLSLIDNNISFIPANLSSNDKLLALSLDSNPIRLLPDGFGKKTTMLLFSIQDTLLEHAPADLITLAEAGYTVVSAFNTPACNQTTAPTEKAAMGCTEPLQRVRNGHFPLALADSLRQLN